MSRGYLVEGVEPNLNAREQAIANHGIPVVPSLELVPLQEQFQVVTLWHVLEHLPNLRATFKRLFALLADGGLLVIAVPDRGCWDADHFGEFWAAWDVPRHFTHFRKSDIQAFLHEHGFELVGTHRMWMDAPYIAMLSTSYQGSSRTIALLKGSMIGLWSNMVSLVTGRPTSSTLYTARKREP
jgi:SAM-dependent methyltransferase